MHRSAAHFSSLSRCLDFHPILITLAACMISGSVALAQFPQQMDSKTNGTNIATRDGATIHIKITGEDKKPLKQQSLIRITSQTTGIVLFQSSRNSEADFPNLPASKYLLEVGAAGYLGMHEQISVPDIAHDVTDSVILLRDPSAVDLTLKHKEQLPAKARKEAEKGIQALELSNFPEALKHLESANHQDPSSASINFLLAYLSLQLKDTDRELSYLLAATKLDPRDAQAQSLLGQLYYDKGDYARASAAEEVVVASNGEAVAARRVLASSYLHLNEYEKAREQSQWLVERGGSEGLGAKLILGQSLAGLRQNEKAIAVLKEYLEAAPTSKVAPQVREHLAKLEKRVAQGSTTDENDTAIGDPAAASGPADVNAGMPVDVDAQIPVVAQAVQCPANLMDLAADRSKEMVDSVAQFSAIEEMVHENLSAQGLPRSREVRKYNYLVSITEPPEGALLIQEFRNISGEPTEFPDQISTSGLPVLALAFHRQFRDDFEMKCEGLGDWNGQPAWLVHFRQREDKAARLRTYIVNKNNYPVALKGRAWFAAESFQPLHVETDLVHTLPQIQLLTEHTSINYAPVQFKKSGTDLWLPESANLYVHFGKRRFHRSESFDHFMLFATDAIDKPKAPAGATQNVPSSDHSGGPRQ
jgi:tetratricopeptide (TPR) repeat protein